MPHQYDHIEWDEEETDAARRRTAEGAIECLYDRKIRVRIGELIARAMRASHSDKR
jgi:hypothetical protein